MKFLRMPNKAQSLRQASSMLNEENKENICPSKPSISLQKHSVVSSLVETFEPEMSMVDQIIERPRKEQQHYEQQILEFLIRSVRKPSIEYNYFAKQTDITEHMRMVLFNWLIDVHLKYKLNPQTLFITMNLIDQFLGKQVVERNELQLIGITCLWISSKYQQTYQVPKLSNLVYICDSTYTETQILDMESRILVEIKFDFLKITSLTFFQTLRRHTHLNEKDYFLGRYLLESVIFDVSTRKYSELTIAASVIFFIQKLRGYDLSKNKKVHQICQLSQKQLRGCARQICFMWQKINQIDQMSSLRQKYMRSQFLQVSKIRISQKSTK